MKVRAVDHVDHASVSGLRWAGSIPMAAIHADGFPGLSVLGSSHHLEARATAGSEGGTSGLPLVHRVIANLKRFLMGTFHGVSNGYLQKYLDEFAFRFHRRWWEPELPFRLLEAAVCHPPLPDKIRGKCYLAHR